MESTEWIGNNMSTHSTEQDYLTSIRVAHAINASGELWDAMTQLAVIYVERGWTQEACDILAFVLLQKDVPSDVHDQAYAAFDHLERSLCPRVIWDARAFAHGMDLDTMLAYLLDDLSS